MIFRQTTAATLNDMKNIISNLPQFQEMKSKYSAHMTIASDCMNEFKYQNLEVIGLIEQVRGMNHWAFYNCLS